VQSPSFDAQLNVDVKVTSNLSYYSGAETPEPKKHQQSQGSASCLPDALAPNRVSRSRHSRNARGTLLHPTEGLNRASHLTATLLHRIDPRLEASNHPPNPADR
jgi:hypothetical protein